MKLPFRIRSWFVSCWHDERGVVLAMALVVIALLMGIGSTALFSGYTNLLTSTNLRIATQARARAEAGVNEALYRLSRQETDSAVIVPDLTDPTWKVEIDFTSGDNNASDGIVSTIQPSADWPEDIPDKPVIVQFKRPDSTNSPSQVLFYDRTQNPQFMTYTLPGTVPDTAHPVIQIEATALDDREAERQILAEAVESVAFPPPAPLSSGVDVDMQGAGFIDGTNHHHNTYITDASGNSAIYGDDAGETTDSHSGNQCDDSPDDNADTGAKHGAANPNATAGYSSLPRLFNMQISTSDDTPAWVGVTKVNPDMWTGVNTNFASPIALSNGPVVLNDTNADLNGVKTKGLFTWGVQNSGGLTSSQANPAYPTSCNTNPPSLVCRPTVLTPFPTLQEFLGLDDVAFQNLLDNADTTEADLNAGSPPLGFTYINGNHTFNNNDPMPGNNDFGLMYVTGNLRMNGGQRFKGLIFVDGDLDTTGNNVLLGAVMVRGITETDANGNFTLLYSTKAAELGIQAGHPWRILSWADTEMQ